MNRVIIGETERAGWPISAPSVDYENSNNITDGTVRWAESNQCFVLEQFRTYWENGIKKAGWCEVGCQQRKATDE